MDNSLFEIGHTVVGIALLQYKGSEAKGMGTVLYYLPFLTC